MALDGYTPRTCDTCGRAVFYNPPQCMSCMYWGVLHKWGSPRPTTRTRSIAERAALRAWNEHADEWARDYTEDYSHA